MNTAEMPRTVCLHSPAWTVHETAQVGDVLENCRLVAELGRGRWSRAFLAEQSTLGNRPLVLKVTPRLEGEHLYLARLQHTHIMPIYWAGTHIHRGLHVIAMPYLAQTNLARLLELLRHERPDRWRGASVHAALQREQERMPIRLLEREPQARLLCRSTYVDFVLCLGQRLAEALAFAHGHRLLHLDIKPDNILVTLEGEPILLDLDVSRSPIPAGTPELSWLGGTPAYMAPEHSQAMEAVAQRQPIPQAIDERADVYALGLVLYEALGGIHNEWTWPEPYRLPEINPQVPRALAAILTRCLATRPEDRYPNCAALAADLERHREHQPLQGVRETWPERWIKWRRRRPWILPMLALTGGLLAASATIALSLHQLHAERRSQAELALVKGQELERQGQHEEAARCYQAGQEQAANTWYTEDLARQLTARLNNALRLRHAHELNATNQLLRCYSLQDTVPRRTLHVLEAACRRLWKQRDLLLDRSAGPLEPQTEEKLEAHLHELVLLWADLQMRLVPDSHRTRVLAEVYRLLEEADATLGRSFAVRLARHQHGPGTHPEPLPAQAWEYRALGRFALSRGELQRAEELFAAALRREPLDPVSHLHRGTVALRRQHWEEALPYLSFSLGAVPTPEAFLQRALALTALGRHEEALADLQLALNRQPDFVPALRERIRLHRQLGNAAEAEADRERLRQIEE